MLRKLLLVVALAVPIVLAPPAGWAQTPLETLGSMSSNNGLYSNRIAKFTPPSGYSEVCFKDGVVLSDVHTMGEPPTGGNCVPGDVGWMIERDQRGPSPWDVAKAECLTFGMRLPEPFEWKYSCRNAAAFGLNDMTDLVEWASNFAMHQSEVSSAENSVGASTLGEGSCSNGTWGQIGRSPSPGETLTGYRCVR